MTGAPGRGPCQRSDTDRTASAAAAAFSIGPLNLGERAGWGNWNIESECGKYFELLSPLGFVEDSGRLVTSMQKLANRREAAPLLGL